MEMKQIKETYINTLVDSMILEDLQQYVANDMASWLYYCNEIGVIPVSYTHLTLPTKA